MPHDRKNPHERHKIEERQQQEITAENETYVFTRSSDFSVWSRSAAFFEKYKVLWYLILGIMFSLGFGFRTPAQYYNDLSSRVDQLGKQAQEAERARQNLERKLDILITFRCLDQNARELSIAGLDCSKFPNPAERRP